MRKRLEEVLERAVSLGQLPPRGEAGRNWCLRWCVVVWCGRVHVCISESAAAVSYCAWLAAASAISHFISVNKRPLHHHCPQRYCHHCHQCVSSLSSKVLSSLSSMCVVIVLKGIVIIVINVCRHCPQRYCHHCPQRYCHRCCYYHDIMMMLSLSNNDDNENNVNNVDNIFMIFSMLLTLLSLSSLLMSS